MKWSTPLLMGSMGTRTTELQWIPSVELLYTMSLAAQPLSKRQSGHDTYTLPAPSMAVEGRPALRRPPASPWLGALAMLPAHVHVWPPLVDMKADMPPPKSANPTITLPLGCTTGFTPIP